MINFPLLVEDAKLYLKSGITDFLDIIQYEWFHSPKPTLRNELPKEVLLHASFDKKLKSFYVECPFLDGIYTAANSIEELVKGINDVIYEYLDVPRYIARKLGNQYNPDLETLERLQSEGAEIKLKVRQSETLATA